MYYVDFLLFIIFLFFKRVRILVIRFFLTKPNQTETRLTITKGKGKVLSLWAECACFVRSVFGLRFLYIFFNGRAVKGDFLESKLPRIQVRIFI